MGVSDADGTTLLPVRIDPATHRILASATGTSGAPADATYVTLSTNATLTNERVLTGTANQITLTDNGAGSTVVISTPQNIATTSTPTFASMTLTAASSLTLGTSSSLAGSFILKNATNANTLTVKSGVTSGSYTLTLPTAVASAGQVLTDAAGNGVLSWSTVSGTGTVTSVSVVTAQGVSGTVATATTTPAITLALGALTGVTSLNGLVVTANTGVITTGTWNGTTIAVANGGTGATTATGTGSVVLQTSPTLTTPTLGVATATSINKVAFTAPATGSTLTILDGKTLTANNSIVLAGTDSTTMTFPSTSATIARTDAGQTFTGVNVFTSPKIITQISDTNGNVLINIGATGSAVNYVKVTNAATGTAGPILSADGETNVDLKLAGKGTGAVHVTTGQYGDITADSDGATITFNLATSNIHSVTLGGNRTLALSNEHVGQCFMLRLQQDGTGSRTVTWFTTIKWAGGVAPTLTTTINKADMFGFVVTSAGNYDGFIIGQNL